MIPVVLPGGEEVPALGQGTWNLGVTPSRRAEEAAALRDGVDLGLTVIDTAEMYGDGATEEFLGEALAGLRDKVFLVSKAYPQHGSRAGLLRACTGSLRRLRIEQLDLYLLHWRGNTPLAETVEGMKALKAQGKIRHWGVSNFDTGDMKELFEAGGQDCATNQILYNLSRRGPEFGLLPWLDRGRIPAMAYSPVEQGRLLGHAALKAVAMRHDATPSQVALAWLLRRPGTIVIPKAGTIAHVRENAGAAALTLSSDDLAALDQVFPPPDRNSPLAML